MQELVIYTTVNGEEVMFTLVLHYKRMKNIVFRASEEQANTFHVSLPYGMLISQVHKVFKKNLPGLLKLEKKLKTVPFTDKTYVFGRLLPLGEIKETFVVDTDLTDLPTFYKAMHKTLLNVLKAEVNHYIKLMNIPVSYKVRIHSMKTRWASNSKQTMTLAFNERLIHFHIDIIRALVVHELVHYFIGGHGADFYEYCERYYPNYKRFDKMLKEHNYGANY